MIRSMQPSELAGPRASRNGPLPVFLWAHCSTGCKPHAEQSEQQGKPDSWPAAPMSGNSRHSIIHRDTVGKRRPWNTKRWPPSAAAALQTAMGSTLHDAMRGQVVLELLRNSSTFQLMRTFTCLRSSRKQVPGRRHLQGRKRLYVTFRKIGHCPISRRSSVDGTQGNQFHEAAMLTPPGMASSFSPLAKSQPLGGSRCAGPSI